MPDISADQVANEVNAGVVDFEGAVMFKGWLLLVADVPPGPVRLFTDPGFMEWLEMPSSAILHQIPGNERLNAAKSSIIWVKREARITFCRSGYAHWFQHLEGEERDQLHHDPTVARHPRPVQ